VPAVPAAAAVDARMAYARTVADARAPWRGGRSVDYAGDRSAGPRGGVGRGEGGGEDVLSWARRRAG
jgi:hypothetical protein